MRHTSKLLLLVAWWAASLSVAAAPVLRNLQILVKLHDNGDADIREIRTMDIDGEGTECYIVIGNLNGSDIKNFKVTDETNQKYVNEGEWNVDRSRQQKAGRCGMVTKSNGYELCWGLGNSGTRIYMVDYTVTNMVRSYEESDGFNWMFVTRDMNPAPQKATVMITADREGGLPHDSIGAWSFGFKGNVTLEEDGVVVTTSEPMTSEMAMIIMLEIQKGIVHPAMAGKGTFKDVRKKAFENSDYEEQTWYSKLWDELKADLEMLFGLLFLVLIFGFIIWTNIRTRIERKKLLKTVNWYREIPVNGNLVTAKKLYNAFFNSGGITSENMVEAMILRLIRTGTLTIENRLVKPTGLKKIFGAEGKYQDCIVVNDFNEKNRLVNTPSLRMLYDMMRAASGDDFVLQPYELKEWMRSNKQTVLSFMKSIDSSASISEAKRTIDDTRQVFGLKMFLEDFTLANERHLTELSLWNDYLVYATLFGIADQLKADMKKLNPEYLEMNNIARNLTNKTVVPYLMAATYNTAHSIDSASRSRSSGGGGSSSFGGGGGFSGGGSGGGVR